MALFRRDEPAEVEPVPTKTSANSTWIAAGTRLEGELRTPNDLYVQGVVDGSVQCKGAVVVQEKARVTANIEANRISLHGDVVGDIVASEHVALHQSSSLRGNVATRKMSVERGARFHGHVRQRPDGRGRGEPGSAGRAAPADADDRGATD